MTTDAPKVVRLRPGLELPIVDCRSWYVAGTGAFCRRDLDVAGCASCPQREGREGNYQDPPVYGRALARRPLPQEPSVGADAPAALPDARTPPEPNGGRLRGLGDVVARVTKAVGIKPCGPCQKRREALNRLVPFERKAPAAGVHPDAATGDERAGGAT